MTEYNPNNDYYDVLGVSDQATKQEIKRGFRIRAVQYHPDKQGEGSNTTQQFIVARNAYDILGDEDLKVIYDGNRNNYRRSTERTARREQSDNIKVNHTGRTASEPKDKNYIQPQYEYNRWDSVYEKSEYTAPQNQSPPKYDHDGKKIEENIRFIKLPSDIGTFISGCSDMEVDAAPSTMSDNLGCLGIFLVLGAIVTSVVCAFVGFTWVAYAIGAAISILAWFILGQMAADNAYDSDIIGNAGFARYTLHDDGKTLTKQVVVRYSELTDMIYQSEQQYTNFVYTGTKFAFSWMSGSRQLYEYSGSYKAKNQKPIKEGSEEYYFNERAEKYWTIYQLDTMDEHLERDGFIEFKYAKGGLFSSTLVPYVRLGIGYIEVLHDGLRGRYNYDDISQMHTNGTELVITHKNYKRKLILLSEGNKSTIELFHITNRRFFFAALPILTGYKFNY